MKLDGPAPAGVQRQQSGRRLRRHGIVEPTRDEHDAALEELLMQPVPAAHAPSVQPGDAALVGDADRKQAQSRRSGARPAMSAVSSRGSTGLAMCV